MEELQEGGDAPCWMQTPHGGKIICVSAVRKGTKEAGFPKAEKLSLFFPVIMSLRDH